MNRKNDGIAEPLTICIIETEKSKGLRDAVTSSIYLAIVL